MSEEDEYIAQDEIAEVVADDPTDVNPAEDEGEDDDRIEIDLSNNSTSYFDKHEDSVFLVTSHPTLPLVATGGGDNLAYVWTTHSRPPKIAAKLEGHTESVVAGGFSADGQVLVTGDMSGQVRVHRARSGGERWEFVASFAEVDEVVFIKFHPTKSIAVVGATDGSAWVYDFSGAEPQNIAVLYAHSLACTAGIFLQPPQASPDALRLVTVSEDGSIILWDVPAQTAIYTLGSTQLRGEHPWVSVCPSPRQTTFAAGAQDGTLVVVKADNGQLLQFIDTSDPGQDDMSKSVEGLDWSEKAQIVAAGNVDGTVKLYDVASWRVRSQFKLRDAVTALQFVPGTRLLVVSSMEGELGVWDVISNTNVWDCTGHSEGVLQFAIQNNGQRLISAGDEGVSLVFDRPPDSSLII